MNKKPYDFERAKMEKELKELVIENDLQTLTNLSNWPTVLLDQAIKNLKKK